MAFSSQLTNGDTPPSNAQIYTTVPRYLPPSQTPTFHTRHLILRLFRETDPYFSLLNEDLVESFTGPPQFRHPLGLHSIMLPEIDYYNSVFFAVFTKTPDNGEQELIGFGGGGDISGGLYRDYGEQARRIVAWPTLVLKFKREYWNRGYATEFLATYMNFWWNRPRNPVFFDNHSSIIRDAPWISPDNHHPELFCATTQPEGRNLLAEVGFDYMRTLDNGQEIWCDWRRD